jgi:hypothetical protein
MEKLPTTNARIIRQLSASQKNSIYSKYRNLIPFLSGDDYSNT